ncbi:MAG: cupin-like domain-containing protein [Ilumatobacteraceae bacterium]|nr:cupin-like domain-containing protein [Ilumatobacteraceae bacterium]
MSARPALIDLAKIAVVGALVALLTPLFFAHRAFHRWRSRRELPPAVTPIPSVGLDERSLADIIDGDEPVIVTGLVEALTLARTPDVSGLRAMASDHPERFPVKVHKDHSPYFLYVGDYGAELDRVEEHDLASFLDAMFVDGPADGECTYRLFSTRDLNGEVGTIVDELATALEAHTGRRAERDASGLWIGSTGVTTPLHHDAWTGILFQFEGSKDVVMYGPDDRPNLYFTSPYAATDRWSTLPGRSRDAGDADYPDLARAQRWEGRLEAGDALFIPAFWAHEVEALEANISIPFRFATRPSDYANPGFLRPAYEILHGKLAATR